MKCAAISPPGDNGSPKERHEVLLAFRGFKVTRAARFGNPKLLRSACVFASGRKTPPGHSIFMIILHWKQVQFHDHLVLENSIPLKAVRAGDRHPHTTTDRIGRDPAFVWLAQVLAARDDGLLDALAVGVRYALDVEDGQRHVGQW